jgi:hypothetical protein
MKSTEAQVIYGLKVVQYMAVAGFQREGDLRERPSVGPSP